MRVVVTGSECTGKTTLAEALAQHYGVAPVPEYVRRFVEEKGAVPVYEDVDAIARGQIALENEHIARSPRVLIQDTDLLSTVVYSHHYYGDCPPWIEAALSERAADLYLLCDIDVPWVPDGDQRDRGDRREEMHALFGDALRHRAVPALEVSGGPAIRLAAAIAAIDALLEE